MNRRNQDLINKKCKLLQQMGFTIDHQDSVVRFKGIQFDFSATNGDIESLTYMALTQMFDSAFAAGKAQVQHDIKQALGIDE
jgi:hypothetical protein